MYVGGEREGPMKFTSMVEAIAGKGLAGDRYALGLGSFSKSKGVRDITLIEIEAVWSFFRDSGIDLHPALLRRNIVTEEVRLPELIGATFSIGTVSLVGLRPCPPCLHLTKLIGIPDVLRGFAHCGGIYAQVLNDGIINVGDPVILQASQ